MSLHEAEIAVSKCRTFANAFDHLHFVKPTQKLNDYDFVCIETEQELQVGGVRQMVCLPRD
jgi:hypothetical protein